MINKGLNNTKIIVNFTDSTATGEDLYLVSGENISTSFGKISKYMKDNTTPLTSWQQELQYP